MDGQQSDPADFVDYEAGAFDMPAETNPESDNLNKEEEKTGLELNAQDSSASVGGAVIAPQLSEEDRDARSVFVKNVHYSADKSEITEHF